ncbi:MAG: two-component regulator propeller domain-containing protein [Rudaea sp.]|nr:two-component regulator propeller domain-containing protein [Rudaea sp.]
MRGRGDKQLDGALWLVAVALLLFCIQCLAAAPGVYNVRFRSYSTNEGLSQATAMVMAQGKTGFIWIGTQDGLDRFDGYGFKVYRHDRADRWSLADNVIMAIAADADGSLWIGTQSGGLDRYDPVLDRFEHHAADPEAADALAADHVTALLIDHRGRLWVASTRTRLQWLDRATNRFRDVPAGARPELANVRALAEQADGSVLIGTRDGLWRCDADGSGMLELRFDPAHAIDVQGLAQARGGEIWVSSTDAGLYSFSAAGAPLAHYHRGADKLYDLPDDEVRGLQFDAAGRLWVAAKSSGLLQLDIAHGSVEAYRHDPADAQSVAANRQNSVLVDSDGLIWAGSWNNGVSVHDPRTEAFVSIQSVTGEPHSLPARPVSAVMGDSDGTLWFGLPEGGGLVHFDLHSGVIARFASDAGSPGGLPKNLIEDVKRGHDGSLWVATSGGGLHRLLPGASGFEHFRHDPGDPDSLVSDDLLFLQQDSAGTLWVATADAGLDELCADCKAFRHHRHDPARAESIGDGPVATVLEARGGELWIALRPGGLDRYDRAHDRFYHFLANAGDAGSLSNNTVTALMQDSRGELWIGTQGGGMNHLLPGTLAAPRFEVISSADGLAADAVGSIVEDAANRLWLSTTAGISRYEPDNRHVINFGSREGALAQGYYINAATRLTDGRIVFGGLSGATIFDPAAVTLPPSPRPIITDVLLNNVPVALRWSDPRSPMQSSPWIGRDSVVLDHRQDNVSFEFSAFGFGDPESIEYSYLLDGHDQQWILTGASRRYATYTNLAPGDYRLRVRARRDGDEWNGGEATLAIRMLPAPWASPLAYLGYAAALSLLAAAVGWRTRATWRLQAAAQESIRVSEERLKYALWGSGGELWDVDLQTGMMLRENRLDHLAATHETHAQTVAAYRPFVHPDDLADFEHALAAHLKGSQEFLEVSYRTPGRNGEWRWLLTRGRVVARDADGHAQRLVGTTTDISTLKRAEESLRNLNEELESRVETRTADLRTANTELRRTLEQLTLAQRQLLESEKMAALGGLVAGVAHEINTPLGVTVTAASYLQEECKRVARLEAENRLTSADLHAFQEAANESAQIILRNLNRADRLIRSFKLVAVDQTTEERRIIDLGAYLNEILTSLGPVLKKSPHHVRVECADALRINTYPGAVYQIISNLVMNSLTHGFEPGQIGEISIVAQRAGALVLLQYHDNGNGMTEAVRAQIFEPFFTTRRGRGGSGLGMHVVYNLVTQLLKGSIRVESTPGAGATFEIFLPADAAATT